MIPTCREHCYHSLSLYKEKCLVRCCWCGASRVVDERPKEIGHGSFTPAR
jgi:hypothetical protein